MSNALFAAEHHETAALAAVHLLHSPHLLPPLWLLAPFVFLLLMIATGPLLYNRFWEHHYPAVSIGLGSFIVLYYSVFMEQGGSVLLRTLEEYISFIALITALFVTSGGILIRIDRKGSPLINAALLFCGALFANLIGTTGASMLLIRPYLRINEGRTRAFHTVFFIFIVSNIGGALTPIGDPVSYTHLTLPTNREV